MNDNKPKKPSSLLAIAVPKPDYSSEFEIEENVYSQMRGDAITDSLVFAIEEAIAINNDAKNNINNSKLSINPTETWVINEINKYDLVHFSTHSTSSNQYGDGKTGVLLNKDNINDGFLSESEISELKLNGQIIYLSSCNSGLGEYVVGEGLLSISRAFLSAGAAGVISSLWPVDDKAAKEISVSYYNNYFKADSPEIAIFNAQKEYNQVHSYLKYPFVYTSY